MHFHTVGKAFRDALIPLIPLLGLVHLRIPLSSFVFGGAGCRDQCCINDRPLLHGHAVVLEVGFDDLKVLFAEIVLLQRVPERENRGLVRDPVADHVHPCETPHRRHLDQRIPHRWIAEVVPLLKQVDPQNGCQRIGRATTLGAGLGTVCLNQIKQRFPRHHFLYLAQKPFPPGALFGCGLLVIIVGEALREALTELLTAHHSSVRQRSHGHCPADGLGFPESP